MSKSVYKYELPVDDEAKVRLPFGSEVLTVAFQGDTLCLWALVQTNEAVQVYRRFAIRGTGHPANDLGGEDTQFLGTAFHPLALVFHVWERV